MTAVQDTPSVVLEVRVVPRASRSEVVGMQGGVLKVRLTSPPVDGAANEELIKLMAKTLDVPKRDIEIITGLTSKTKRIRIWRVSERALAKVIK
jgi:uncharacterized protein